MIDAGVRRAAPPFEATLILLARGIRAFADGFVSVLLPADLLALGYGTWQVGVISSAALPGSALTALLVGCFGHLVRAGLSQMDVPTRSAFVMAVVTPPERAAASSCTW